MDEGLQLTADGYVLRPKRAAYRTATLVGLAMAGLGVIIGASIVVSSGARAVTGTRAIALLMAVGAAILFTFVGWFTSRPPVLTVSTDELTLRGGSYRQRQDRSGLRAIWRGDNGRATRDKAYFLFFKRAVLTIPVRHFNPTELEDAMRRLDVPISGDFSRSPALGDLFQATD